MRTVTLTTVTLKFLKEVKVEVTGTGESQDDVWRRGGGSITTVIESVSEVYLHGVMKVAEVHLEGSLRTVIEEENVMKGETTVPAVAG